jgi:branched-subunit amino acid transport protein
MTTWLAVAGVGLGSYALRLVPLLVGERLRWSDRIERAMDRAGLAALTALVVSGLQHHEGGDGPWSMLWTLAAVTVAVVVARRGRSLLWVVGAGLATYWLPTALIALCR